MSVSTEQPDAAAVEPRETLSSDDATRKPRLLMLTHRLPYPPDRGDRIRAYHMLRLLGDHVDLALASVSDEAVWLQHHQLLSTMARRVALYPINAKVSKLRGLMGAVAGRAITPSCFFRQGLAQQICQWQEEEPFDIVLTFCTGMIDYYRALVHHPTTPFTGRHIIDLVDVDSAKWREYARKSVSPMKLIYALESRRLRKIEAGRYDPFDAVAVVSEAEAKTYREWVGGDQRVVPVGNGVDMDYFHPQDDAQGQTLCFVGVLNYRPNSDAVSWFAKRVMPKLVRKLPDARFQIIGRHPTQHVQDLAQYPGVEVVGSVPDVRAYLADAAAVVAPLLIARGIQNKVLEAMSSQRAVVCSPAAAEGIEAEAGKELILADEPDTWVAELERVLTDAVYRQRIAQAARRRIEQAYSWESRLQPLLGLIREAPAQ